MSNLDKPLIAQYPFWKAILFVVGLGFGVGLMALAVSSAVYGRLQGGVFIINFAIFIILAMVCKWGIWRYPGKYKAVIRWVGTVCFEIYMTSLFLIAGIMGLRKLLPGFWGNVIAIFLTGLFIAVYLLPILSPKKARDLSSLQDEIGLKVVLILGPSTSVLAALLGMYSARHNEEAFFLAILAILSPVIAISWAQYHAYYHWKLRPWAHANAEVKEGTDEGLADDGYLRHGRSLTGHVTGPPDQTPPRRQGVRGWLSFFRKTAEDYLAQGAQQAMRGEYAKAVKSLTKALEQDPNL
ncbi:MAG: hypothetical protein GXN93_01165, partial [Candidatus Diapherotrites archaeon]|nr:hypothetical protein [Candidatus Diapherotrites archaeon]